MSEPDIRLFAYTSIDDRVWITSPDWLTVEKCLKKSFERGGGVTLEIGQSESTSAARSVVIRASPQRYLLIATNIHPDGKKVRRWRKLESMSDHPFVEVGGDEWDFQSVLYDVSVAERVFEEFFLSRTLAPETLTNMR